MGLLFLCALLLQGAQTPPASPPPPAADALIFGRVLDPAGAPVAAAVVSLQSARGSNLSTTRVLTDDDGRYFFDRLEPGLYNVLATKMGWVDSSVGKRRVDGAGYPVSIAEHDRKGNTNITMWKLGALSGTIVDELGEPLVDIEVRAVRRTLVSGTRQMVFAGSARTDDRGVYRISGVRPGEYTVFVPATVMSGAMTFPPGGAPQEWLRTMTGEGTAPMSFDFDAGVLGRNGTSFVRSVLGVASTPPSDAPWLAVPPSFAGVVGAASFTIASGQERIGIDMMLRLTTTYPVSGTLTMPEGSAANLVLHLMSASLESFPLFDVATAATDSAGRFTFYGVPPGDYVIRVVRTPLAPGGLLGIASSGANAYVMANDRERPGGASALPTEPLWHVTQRVAVSNAPVKDLQLTLKPGPRVSGRIEYAGASVRPDGKAWNPFAITLDHANGYVSRNPPRVVPGADGESFASASVLPGDYYVRVNPPAGWYLKSVVWQGHNIIDAPLALGTNDVTDIVVTLSDRPARIEGDVYGADDQPALSSTVLVFPVDQDLWTEYGRVSPRMDAARVNHEGKFSTKTLVDGSYYMIAVADETAFDWQDPATLAKLAKQSRQVTVRDGETSHENLKLEKIK